MKPLISRGLVSLACAMSIVLAGAAFYVGAWPLGFIHLFVAIVLLGAYLRPMQFDVVDEVQRVKDQTEEFVS